MIQGWLTFWQIITICGYYTIFKIFQNMDYENNDNLR